MDSRTYNSLKRLRLNINITNTAVCSPCKRRKLKADSACSQVAYPVLQTFNISTRVNLEYAEVNQFLRSLHVAPIGTPDEDVEMQERDPYESINQVLREAFLERHSPPPTSSDTESDTR
ncbi:hypothetical protein BX666DRAFT_1888462 [Dichotomocladium elegans]|nr:hypothetical protein BX666DRAFT_1888462 [Dichotomocladium elegans]